MMILAKPSAWFILEKIQRIIYISVIIFRHRCEIFKGSIQMAKSTEWIVLHKSHLRLQS